MHLKKCSGCARAIVESATSCDYCGHPAAGPVESVPGVDNYGNGDDVLVLEELFEDGPQSPEVSPEEEPPAAGFPTEQPALNVALDTSTPQESPTVPEAPEPAAVARRTIGKRQLMTGLVGVAAGVVLIVMTMSARGAASKDEAVSAQTASKRQAAANTSAPKTAAANSAPNAALVRPAPAAAPNLPPEAPKWVGNAEGWAPNDRRAAAFEVASTGRVQVWMRTVQPMLVVRCRVNKLEAFVFTDTAAKMEPQDQDHTVRLRFDGGAETTARWPDSSEHDALFARDSESFVRALLAAQTLRFGFTPHNADPVVAVFNVAGLQQHLASARACGSKTSQKVAALRLSR